MVSTNFRTSVGLKLTLPDAEKIEKLPGNRGVVVIWIDRTGRMTIDDVFISVDDISKIVYKKVVDPLNPLKVVSLKIDKDVEMGKVTAIQEELRIVGGGALNVNYAARKTAD
jgi:biopolymer transport protein ExbD